MGFCGCTLRDSTTSASIYGIIFSIFGISWTSVMINKFQEPIYEFLVLSNSYGSMFSLDNLVWLRFDKVVFGLIAFSLSLHILWFLSSVLMIFGNQKSNPTLLYLWIPITSIILISDFGGVIYCAIKAINVLPNGVTDFYTASILLAPFHGYILIASMFNKLGIISIGIQISLAVFVSGRAKEIIRQQKTPDVAVISHPPVVYGQQMQHYPMQSQPLNSPNMQPYPMQSQPSPNMQPYPMQSQPSPNMQPLQHRLAEDWNQPAPQYTKYESNRTENYPYERDHTCESKAYLQNRPANPYRHHSREDLLKDDQYPPPRPGTKYYEPKPDYNYYEGQRY